MLTDWLIVRRVAAELDAALRGARVRAAGRFPDGRFGIGTARGTIAIDAFGPTPLAALETDGELESAAGWTRALSDVLEGLRIDRIRARRGDRLIAFDCSARSRFGVTSAYRLVAELVPRFGNVLLLKDETIVAAAKEFSHRQNHRRAVVVGEAYEPPPLPEVATGDGSLEDALAAVAATGSDAARAGASRALRAAVPLLPRLVADSFVADSMRALGAAPAALAERCRARAHALVDGTLGDPSGLGDVFAYRDGAGALVQCHVLPLAQFSASVELREPAILPLLASIVGRATTDRAAQAFASRRNRLAARLDARTGALAAERDALERERDDEDARDRLRSAGESIYAHLAEIPAGAASFVPPSAPNVTVALDPELDAKANAAAIFKRYRKSVAKLEHVARRLASIDAELAFAGEIAWELERAEPDTLDDVADAAARFERRQIPSKPAARDRRKPLDVRIASDARIYVGRSPKGNSDLTFRVARPDDLWFHARETPGAHVVLRIDGGREPAPDELELAAQLAAYHSKARGSDKVSVDYTSRKFVRRAKNAPPGLVWYTNARTLVVAPREHAARAEHG